MPLFLLRRRMGAETRHSETFLQQTSRGYHPGQSHMLIQPKGKNCRLQRKQRLRKLICYFAVCATIHLHPTSLHAESAGNQEPHDKACRKDWAKPGRQKNEAVPHAIRSTQLPVDALRSSETLPMMKNIFAKKICHACRKVRANPDRCDILRRQGQVIPDRHGCRMHCSKISKPEKKFVAEAAMAPIRKTTPASILTHRGLSEVHNSGATNNKGEHGTQLQQLKAADHAQTARTTTIYSTSLESQRLRESLTMIGRSTTNRPYTDIVNCPTFRSRRSLTTP